MLGALPLLRGSFFRLSGMMPPLVYCTPQDRQPDVSWRSVTQYGQPKLSATHSRQRIRAKDASSHAAFRAERTVRPKTLKANHSQATNQPLLSAYAYR